MVGSNVEIEKSRGSEHCYTRRKTGSSEGSRDERGDPEKIIRIENNVPSA